MLTFFFLPLKRLPVTSKAADASSRLCPTSDGTARFTRALQTRMVVAARLRKLNNRMKNTTQKSIFLRRSLSPSPSLPGYLVPPCVSYSTTIIYPRSLFLLFNSFYYLRSVFYSCCASVFYDLFFKLFTSVYPFFSTTHPKKDRHQKHNKKKLARIFISEKNKSVEHFIVPFDQFLSDGLGSRKHLFI